MVIHNLCRCCGNRVSNTVKKCLQCGSLSDTNRSKKILSSIFLMAAVLLIYVVFCLCSR